MTCSTSQKADQASVCFRPIADISRDCKPPLVKWKLPALLLAAGAAGATAFALRSPGTREVAGQHFAVPDEWLFNGRIAWLPAPAAGSFTFHLDPVRDPNEIPSHLVSVEASQNVCRPDGQAQIVRVACGREQTTVRVGPPYQKVFPQPDDATQWDYYSVAHWSADGQTRKLQVAWCTPIEPNPARPNGTAICTSVWGVDGLVLSLGFEESDLAQLPIMRARATQMLLSWKVR